MDIADDLYDYEDDVLKNSFNAYRMFIRIYGPAKVARANSRVCARVQPCARACVRL